MNTTTKCQHALVIGSLAIILIVIACIAFLSPPSRPVTRNVMPVTQVVTPVTPNPGRFFEEEEGPMNPNIIASDYFEDGQEHHTHKTTKHSKHSTRSTPTTHKRNTQSHSTKKQKHDDDEHDNERMDMFPQLDNGPVGPGGFDGFEGNGPNADIPVAMMMPADVVNHTNSRSKRNVVDTVKDKVIDFVENMGNDGEPENEGEEEAEEEEEFPENDMKSAGGMAQMKRNMGMPDGKQMQMHMKMHGLEPNQLYAVMMHQYGDMQNGCDKLGPAFNSMMKSMGSKGSMSNDDNDMGDFFGSRKKRSTEHKENKEHKKHKHHKDKEHKLSHKQKKQLKKYAKAHNGTLMGFFIANETGHANASFMVPMAHQQACAGCGAVFGRSMNIRPVYGLPAAGMGAMMGDGMEWQDGVKEFVDSMKDRKKRATETHISDHGNYHHRNQQSQGMGGQGPVDMGMMNKMAQDGTLHGDNMHGYMGQPCSCGVFVHNNTNTNTSTN